VNVVDPRQERPHLPGRSCFFTSTLIGRRKELRQICKELRKRTTSSQDLQFKNICNLLHINLHGVPAVSSQPHPGIAQPRCPQYCRSVEKRLRDTCGKKWREDGVNDPVEWSHGMQRNGGAGISADNTRLPQNIRHGHRLRPLVFGLTLDLEQRQTRQMAQLTSSNILLSR
jgi:hypothetical protein